MKLCKRELKRSKQNLHEAAEDLFGIVVDFRAGETDARAIEGRPGAPLQLNETTQPNGKIIGTESLKVDRNLPSSSVHTY